MRYVLVLSCHGDDSNAAAPPKARAIDYRRVPKIPRMIWLAAVRPAEVSTLAAARVIASSCFWRSLAAFSAAFSASFCCLAASCSARRC